MMNFTFFYVKVSLRSILVLLSSVNVCTVDASVACPWRFHFEMDVTSRPRIWQAQVRCLCRLRDTGLLGLLGDDFGTRCSRVECGHYFSALYPAVTCPIPADTIFAVRFPNIFYVNMDFWILRSSQRWLPAWPWGWRICCRNATFFALRPSGR